MVSIAKENLFHEKVKAGMSISAVILTVFLVFTINGVYYGLNNTMDSLVYDTNADVWVLQEDTSGSMHSPSLLNQSEIEDLVKAVDGIDEYAPFIRTTVIYESKDDSNKMLIVNGYDTEKELGGPWNIFKGQKEPENGEIIIDYVFAKNEELNIGDDIEIMEEKYEIVGLSDETNAQFAYLVFLTFEDAQDLMPPDVVNSFLIQAESSKKIDDIIDDLEDILPSDVEARSSDEVADDYRKEVLGSMAPILFVMGLIALFVGTLVIALLIYMITVDKSKEYGLIKAVGASNRYLYKIVLYQSLMISLIGFALGALISIFLIPLIQFFVPEFIALITIDMVIQGFILFMVTGVIASFIPIRKLSSIDPALVFK
jgi:putative ABC transport system permease protein